MKLGTAIQEYTDYKRSLGMDFRTDATRLRAFLRQTGDVEIDSISAENVQAYLKGREGLRIGEALRLTLADMNLNDGLLMIRETKFFKSRLVPIGRDLTQMLQQYYDWQWAANAHAVDSPVLCTRKHIAVSYAQAHYVFQWLRTEVGIMRFDGGRFQPRLHDFRQHFCSAATDQLVPRRQRRTTAPAASIDLSWPCRYRFHRPLLDHDPRITPRGESLL